MTDFTPEELTEAFEYLDELRASGRVNIWAAHAFLVRDLAWPGHEANAATGLWMKTFAHGVPVQDRVAQAGEAGTAETVKQGSVHEHAVGGNADALKGESR